MMDRETFVERATRDESRSDAGDAPVVVHLSTALDVDVDPLAAYAALGDGDYDFLLESAEKVASSDPNGAFAAEAEDRHARHSFVGYDPAAVVTVERDGTRVDALGDDRYEELLGSSPSAGAAEAKGDTLDRLRGALPDLERRGFSGDERFAGGLVGFLAYDAVYDLWLDERGVDHPDSRFPDAQFVLSTSTLVFDHVADALSLSVTPVVWPDDDAGTVYDDLVAEVDRVREALADAAPPETGGFVPDGETAGPRDAYEDAVRAAKEHVAAGDIYQGVVSRERRLRGEVDPLGLYDALREVNPSPYMYCLGYDDLHVVGASPETLVSVRDGEVVANPIAGTCERGASPMEDRKLAGELLADEKERAEHAMLVDLARNDVRRVSEAGSVRVEEFMNVLKYSHVQHIESTVVGDLAAKATAAGRSATTPARPPDAFDATRAAFPAGTLSGAPKIRAMEIIDDLERTPRGLYGGGVGYYSWTGDADVAIVIRTATVERGGEDAAGDADLVTVRAGAGVVADSDPAAEFDETEQKMDGVLAALERIEVDEATDDRTADDAAAEPPGVSR
ncbi:anthranilate synthase component I [Halomicrococcus sp. NG-SE-24]|uniref:anthranilate synthase component I n=1 Tax=Halomicrococcus sp. NG-SE-24 TaxID=3436928 RepID=UPI003D97C0AE